MTSRQHLSYVPGAVVVPPQWRGNVKVRDGELRIEMRAGRHGCVILFLGVWISGWSLGCVGLLQKLLSEPGVKLAVIALVFLTFWTLVAGLLLFMLVGRTRLRFTPDRVSHEACFGALTFWRRCVPAFAIRGVERGLERGGKSGPVPSIRVLTGGSPIVLATTASCEDDGELIRFINQWLVHHPATPEPVPADPRVKVLDLEVDNVLVRMRTNSAPGELRVRWTSRPTVPGLIASTLFSWFWSGMVLACLVNSPPIGVVLFLTPFMLIGLAAMAGWLWTVTLPVASRRLSLLATTGTMCHERRLLGLCWHRTTTDLATVVRAESRDGRLTSSLESSPRRIVLLDAADAEVAQIGWLSVAECKRLRAQLRVAFPAWFKPAQRPGPGS
ncbi:MAG: hypothetical protein AB7K09_03295 [Planctomycetota bacterium]